MPFLTDFNDNPEDGTKGGRLEVALIYHSDRYDVNIVVPVGFYSDYGSVPWWVPPGIVPRGAQFRPAYYVHDFIYVNPHMMSRWRADVILRDAMYELLPSWKKKVRSWLAWCGVRLNFKRALFWD